MQNVLIIAPDDDNGPVAPVGLALRRAGNAVARITLDRDSSSITNLLTIFDGCPPDVLLADLSTTADCLPIRHAIRLLQHTWGEDMPRPICLALLELSQLSQPDWLANTDDFLLPPYNVGEVLARIEMLLFRKRHILAGARLSIGDLTVDLSGGRALDEQGRILPLTPREFDLLRFLVTHRGKFFARDRLLDLVWGIDFEGGERTVDIHVRRLRAKLPPLAASLLETRRGIGYGLVPPSG